MRLQSIELESASSSSYRPELPLDEWYERMERVEATEGWMSWCQCASIYVVPTTELVEAVVTQLRGSPGPILEIGAGEGDLSHAIQLRGVSIIPTDLDPGPLNSSVLRYSARDTLKEFSPATVLTSFLPIDAGIEREILNYPSVRQYLYIGPLVNERIGPEALWSAVDVSVETLTEVNRCLLTRLDYLTDFTRRTHQQRAGAIMVRRHNLGH